MSIIDLITLAERLESLSRRSASLTLGKDKAAILEEIDFIAQDLRRQADRIDEEMAAEAEQYEFA